MKIYLLVLWSDSLAYTIASALASSGHTVIVRIADVQRDNQSKWSLSPRIANIPGVEVVSNEYADVPDYIDLLIVQGHPLLLSYNELLNLLASRASRITAVSAGDRSRSYRQALRLQWQEKKWYEPWFGKVRRIAYKDGFYPLDLFGLYRSRRVVGFDPHSKFLNDETLRGLIHAQDWSCESRRSIRINFLGSRDPDARGRILNSIEPFFLTPKNPSHNGYIDKRMFWHVYSDAEPAALSPEEFVGILSESDFTLAPLGFSLVTHRPVEALLRGSIPVLNAAELDLYDLGLVDGVNCIGVPSGEWPAAMERICDLNETQIIGMRRNIHSMLANRVSYPALARNISARLGLDV